MLRGFMADVACCTCLRKLGQLELAVAVIIYLGDQLLHLCQLHFQPELCHPLLDLENVERAAAVDIHRLKDLAHAPL